MKIRELAGPVAAVAVVAIGTAVPASAVNNVKPFGVQETLKYNHGAIEIGYTVAGLAPSTDAVADPVNGQLYESTVTVDGVSGWVNPVVPFFNARAESGQNYRVLGTTSLSSAAVPPGGQSTGKIYFDVVGDVPNSVVYNDGMTDLLAWVP